MRVGVELDDELVVKRVDVAGDADKLFGKLYSLTQQGFTVVFSVPHFRARQEMKLELVDRGIPIKEELDVLAAPADESEGASSSLLARSKEDGEAPAPSDTAHRARKLRRGVVNIVDVNIPLGEARSCFACRYARFHVGAHHEARRHHRHHLSLQAR